MAWNRGVELSIGTDGGQGLLISGLNIDFSIQKSVKGNLNTATFNIYNASSDTITKILKAGNNVIFKAGYEDEKNINKIFVGTIITSKTHKSGIDKVTEVVAVDIGGNKKRFETAIVSVSYKEDTTLDSVINDLASELSIPVAGIDNISGLKLSNGIVFACSVNNALNQLQKILAANLVGLYFDNNELVLYKLGNADSRFSVVKITPKSGLVGTVELITDDSSKDDQIEAGDSEKDTKKRIKFTSLLNSKLIPNSAISIESDALNGSFIIENVEHKGTNYGGDFISIVEAVE